MLDKGVAVGGDWRFVAFAARGVEKLGDDGVHLFDVGGGGFARGFVGDRQLTFQAQAGERRAQVVRNPGQHDGALGGGALQVVGHAVECLGHLP